MSRPIGDSVLAYGVCLFGSWTIFCYALLLAGAGFSDLLGWCFVPIVVGLVLGALCAASAPTAEPDGRRVRPDLIATGATSAQSVWLLLVMPAIALALRNYDAPYWTVWLALLMSAILVFRASSIPGTKYFESTMPQLMSPRAGLLVLVILATVLVAVTHRPDLDDSQYLNFVVTPMDFPFEALFSHSGLWQDHSVPLELPIYRLHTYELFVATLSQLIGVDHKLVYYVILAPAFGAIAVLVHWRIAQFLAPTYAFSIVLTWLVLLIALGESHRELGNFAFVRLYQGKAILVTVALPLCLLLGLRFADVPDWRRGLTLGMAAIASLGMSSSALATVPFVVAAALSGGLLAASRASILRIVVAGLIFLGFLVAIGVLLLITMNLAVKPISFAALPSAASGLSTVLGEGILGAMIVALFTLAPLFGSEFRRRRLYATTTLMFVIAVLNPWTAPLLSSLLDTALLWRIFWSVPFLISAAVTLTALAALAASHAPVLMRPAVQLIALAAVLLSSSRLSISTDNGVVIATPGYKVASLDHAIAAEIVRSAPLRSTIYAPTSITHLITTFRLHPYPLVVRPEYLGFERIRNHIGDAELDRRRRVLGFLEGTATSPSTADFFQVELARDQPSFVAYQSTVSTAPLLAPILGAQGYVGERRGSYWLWERSGWARP